jgi:probable phosphoglycerate mutase
LFLVRHGQTAWNTERRFLGRTDVPLDDVGRGQAIALGRALGRVDAVWSSPLQRARATASALECSTPPRTHPGLAEMDMGELEGMGGEAFAQQHPALLRAWRSDPSIAEIPGGETMARLQARVCAAWAEILADSPTGRVVVVSHQLALSSLLCALARAPLSEFRRYTQRNTAWSEVVGGEVRFVDHAPHLTAS